MAVAASLTLNDSLTLARLFDPESSPDANLAPISPSLPADPNYPLEVLSRLQSTELDAIRLSDASPTDALSLLGDLIAKYPRYASARNNRAQLRRILKQDKEEVLADLDEAIRIATPTTPLTPVSNLQAKVLCAAWTQKGAVLLGCGDEDRAAAAFQAGARYGGEVARQMAVRVNPYAQLCGAIVEKAMRKELGVR
jgi:hypothetical protein